MADLVNTIPVVVDGESAYDFRLKVNQAISGVNAAFEKINEEYNSILEASEQYEELIQYIEEAKNEVEQYVENEAKPEIKEYFSDFIENGLEDLSTIQVRRNEPQVDSTGYLPEFWFQIQNASPSDHLVRYAKLISPSSVFSNLRLEKNSGWTGASWTIKGYASYNSDITPTANDVIGVMLTLEDGCIVKSEQIKNDSFNGVAPECSSYTGLQPEYDANSKTIFWTCGRVSNWDQIKNISVNDITVTDGVIEENFNITLTLMESAN